MVLHADRRASNAAVSPRLRVLVVCLILGLLPLAASGLEVPELWGRVVDQAGLLSDEAASRLGARL
ncbi:MAG: hypothetical protein MI919_00975, partial [Holophagales bacterium]|nr:hypothetical protein [Holophagales bacterium]